MARPFPVIVNATAGTGNGRDAAEELREHFAAAGAQVQVMVARNGEDLSLLAKRAVREGHPVVIAAGGDGTINAVATHVAGSRSALGVLPMGTLNHFARDAGIPSELDAAVRTIVAGHRIRVDVGAVNGKVFLNNSSIGLYPTMVTRRDNRRRRQGSGKWTALFWASLTVLRKHPMLDVELHIDGATKSYRTPLIFIGNNEYVVEGPGAGRRSGLCDGKLAIYITRRHGRRGLVALALRALVGSLRDALDLEALTASSVTIATRRSHLPLATDGEVNMMPTPLRYETRAGALEVVVPAPEKEESAA
ncbi:MAG TPA: diacylglycerol kinase family protein [Usitatibacter sp.]|nr:diacylglycerol kinase family protein [Usitatibacter sp.]